MIFGRKSAKKCDIIIIHIITLVNIFHVKKGLDMNLLKKNESIPAEERIFSNKGIMKIIVPMFIQQLLSITVGMADSMMVSYAGEAAVSGVSLVNTLDNMLIVFFTALVSGGSVVVAQALGSKERKKVTEVAKQLLYATTAVAVLLTVIVLILRRPILTLLFGEVEADVMQSAQDYFWIVALSFPLLAISESIGACFRSAGNSMISLIVSLAINIMNVGGNAIFIFGCNMEAKGAALATTIARFGGAVILLILIHNKKYPVHIERLFSYKPDFKIVRKILNIGVPNGVENIMFSFGRLLTQTLISMLGTTVIAANSVALSIANYQYAVNIAISACVVPIVGQCIGAGKKDQAKYYSRLLLILEYAMLAVVIAITAIFIKPLISTYNISDEGISLAIKLLVFHSIVAVLIYPFGFLMPSTFRAAGDARFSMIFSMISMWCIRVACAYVLALDTVSVFGWFTIPGLGLGIWGVWIAMAGDWLMRAIVYAIRYFSGKWLRMKKLM